jgi:antitoxin component of RelBE/YafQ-DinJ toxin-antitoxin module
MVSAWIHPDVKKSAQQAALRLGFSWSQYVEMALMNLTMVKPEKQETTK